MTTNEPEVEPSISLGPDQQPEPSGMQDIMDDFDQDYDEGTPS